MAVCIPSFSSTSLYLAGSHTRSVRVRVQTGHYFSSVNFCSCQQSDRQPCWNLDSGILTNLKSETPGRNKIHTEFKNLWIRSRKNCWSCGLVRALADWHTYQSFDDEWYLRVFWIGVRCSDITKEKNLFSLTAFMPVVRCKNTRKHNHNHTSHSVRKP